ncbi:16S rRNA (uracil(1498)-N(3))-methyltransferase [Pusillimonas sp. T2]|uniref:16S rRNA (uracil(1498)-N(3))-methyltransferase n=1 Tax=Pusillimonas sp. T2 TaxID=1548123 RepID=UPI000B9D3029|nr:16S rRNA (uracil(1498)-N(3))-methyltransferase [Pusillimonas sp. T2]OXR50611.1 16S rRNA (uracil(1498)-N(3))-methyltransferase [Pusillimonas sp. T2]
MPRFYCPTPLTAQHTMALPDALAHHAVRVLRLKNNSPITLFDGTGGEYQAILHIDGKHAFAQLDDKDPIERELPGHITLAQGLASGDKMDWIIEKAVELGATRVVPIAARRSVLQLSGSRAEKRLQHWEKTIQSACEQCGRNRLPTVTAPVSLADFLASGTAGLTLLCHPQSSTTLAQAVAGLTTAHITLLVGPEGGWSDEETATALKHGATQISFGARVLRTETAGLAMISAISALLGWH